MYRHICKNYICEIIELKSFIGQQKLIALNPVSFFRLANALKVRLNSDIFDIVVISFSDLPNLVNSLLSRNSIISITGIPEKRNGVSFLRYLLWRHCLNSISVLLCKKIVPCSPVVISKFAINLPTVKDKIYYINGFLDEFRLKQNEELAEAINTKFPKRYFLYIGRIDKNKSVDKIIESYLIYTGLVHNKANIIPLVIIGSGPLETYCRKISDCHGLTRNSLLRRKKSKPSIYFLPDTEDGYTYILNAKVVLLGSKSEGFSNVALESIYANTPIFLAANKGNQFLCDYINYNRISSSVKLLPLLNSKKSTSIWASYMQIYASIKYPCLETGLRENVIQNCSAEVNIKKWIKILNEC